MFLPSPFPFSLSLLPWSSSPVGDDWASGGAIRLVFARPFAGDEHPSARYARPFSSLLPAVRNGALQTLSYLYSDLTQLRLLTAILFAKIIGYIHAYTPVLCCAAVLSWNFVLFVCLPAHLINFLLLQSWRGSRGRRFSREYGQSAAAAALLLGFDPWAWLRGRGFMV